MADISAYLKKILSAVYGEDVRGSIHDSIKKINENVEVNEDHYNAALTRINNLDVKVDRTIREIASDLVSELEEKIRDVDYNAQEAIDRVNSVVDEVMEEISNVKTDLDGAIDDINNEIINTRTELSELIISANKALKHDTDVRYSLTTDDIIGGPYSMCPFKILTKPGLTPEDREYDFPSKYQLLRRGLWGEYFDRYVFYPIGKTGTDTWIRANCIGNMSLAYSIIDVSFSVNDGYHLELFVHPKGEGDTEEDIVYNGHPITGQWDRFEKVSPDSTGYYKIEKYRWFYFTLYKDDGDFPIESSNPESDVDGIFNALLVTSIGQNIISRAATIFHERVLTNVASAKPERYDDMTDGDSIVIVENPSIFKMSDRGEIGGLTDIRSPVTWTEYEQSEIGTKTNTTQIYIYDIDSVLFFENCDREPDVYFGAYALQLSKKEYDERLEGGYAFEIPVNYHFAFGVYTNASDAGSIIKPLPSVRAFSRSEWENYKTARTLYLDLKSYIDDKFYVPITINSLSLTPSSLEIGGMTNEVTLRWATSRTPESAKIRYKMYDGTGYVDRSVTVDPSLTSHTITGIDFSSNNPNFRLTVIDEKNNSVYRDISLLFLNRVYWGCGSDFPGVTGSSNALASSRGRTLSVSARSGEYIWYAYPSSWGDASFIVGGFEGGFSLYDTIDITYSSGYTAQYKIYKSDNAGLGSVVVNVQ